MMESIKRLNKMIADFGKVAEQAKKEAEAAIEKLPKSEQLKYRNLMNKVSDGSMSVEELMKQINNG